MPLSYSDIKQSIRVWVSRSTSVDQIFTVSQIASTFTASIVLLYKDLLLLSLSYRTNSMSDLQLYTDLSMLPSRLRKEVQDFIEFLKTKALQVF
jgi:hypothetical protein